MKKIIFLFLLTFIFSCNKKIDNKSKNLNLLDWVDSRYVKVNTSYYLNFLDLDYKNFLLRSKKLMNEKELIIKIKENDKQLIDAILNQKIKVKNTINSRIESKVKNVSFIKYRTYLTDNNRFEDGTFREKVVIEDKNNNKTLLLPYNTNEVVQIDSILNKKYNSELLVSEIISFLNYKKHVPINNKQTIIEKTFYDYTNYITSENPLFLNYILLPDSYKNFSESEVLNFLKIKPDVPFQGYFIERIEGINCSENLYVLDYDIDLGNNIYALASRVLVKINNERALFFLYENSNEFVSDYSFLFNSEELKCINKKMKRIIDL
mgnify:FL=1